MCYKGALLSALSSCTTLTGVLNSGIAIATEVLSMYADMKLRSAMKYFGLLVKKEGGNRGVYVDFHQKGVPVSSPEKDERWFVAMSRRLTDKEPRFVLFDFFHKQTLDKRSHEKRTSFKLVFIYWCPEMCSVGEKMIYASSKGVLRRQLGGGIAKEFCIHNRSDLDYEKMASQLFGD